MPRFADNNTPQNLNHLDVAYGRRVENPIIYGTKRIAIILRTGFEQVHENLRTKCGQGFLLALRGRNK